MLKKLRWLGLGVVMGSASLCAATLSGEAIEVASDVVHPNGNVYDQVLMRGAFATVRADPGQVMRISFVGLTDDIVQVEFSGKGLLSIFLADASGPAPAVKYNQPGVDYMRGHASLRIDGPDATTNLSVFSVGRLTAVNQALFRSDVPYDGFADLAVVEIEPDPAALAGLATFGGLRLGDVQFFASQGYTGIFAPEVNVQDRVVIGDVSAYDEAMPVLLFGDASKFSALEVAGGDLFQPNGSALQTKGFDRISMGAGTSSANVLLPSQIIRGRIERNGQEVTGSIVTYPVVVQIGAVAGTTNVVSATPITVVVAPAPPPTSVAPPITDLPLPPVISPGD